MRLEPDEGIALEESGVQPEEEQRYREMARALKAIAHPCRICILESIATREFCVSDLQKILSCSQANVSQHLGLMRDRGLVMPERRGNTTRYFLRDERVLDLLRLAGQLFAPPARREPGTPPRLPEDSSREGSALVGSPEQHRARRLARTATASGRVTPRRQVRGVRRDLTSEGGCQ
jgi:DNA-binding transcriptional ArsR family regulator